MLKFFGETFGIGGAQFTYGSVLMVVIFAVLWYVLNRTAWGHVYAIGDDKAAAELSGIRTDRTLLTVNMVAGLICAIGAWAAIGRVGSVSRRASRKPTCSRSPPSSSGASRSSATRSRSSGR